MNSNILSSLFLASNVSLGLTIGLIVGCFVIALGIGFAVGFLIKKMQTERKLGDLKRLKGKMLEEASQ